MKNLLMAMLVMASTTVWAQDQLQPRKSPFWSTHHMVKDTYIKVTYGRPHKSGREIFGENGLVKYGEVWRTGANEATEITVTRDVKLSGMKLHAGTYSLFTIPAEKQWTIIINRDLGGWGMGDYNQEHDVFRFHVPVKQTDFVYEPFTIEFVNKEGGEKFEMAMMWDKTRVVIPVEVF